VTVRPTAPPVVSAAAPPRVADLIAAAADGPVTVLHASPEMVHLDLGGRAVGVASASAPGLPHALRTDLTRRWFQMWLQVSSRPVPTAYVDSGILNLGGRALVARRLVDVRAPRLDAVRTPTTSPAVAQGTPRPRGAGLVALPATVEPRTVPDLVGRGDGLTPLGDDVICGWLAAHRAARVATPAVDDAVRRALPRTTTLSATLLDCALRGEVADLTAGYLRALGTASEGAARAALTRLGHSSGEGLAHGIDLGLRALVKEVAALPRPTTSSCGRGCTPTP
jgi:hypothetical protein